jgi:uncharacterized protein YjbJ (UPF0337 family)
MLKFRKERKMVTAQKIEGNWNEIKGKLQKRWGQLSDDVFQQFHGNASELAEIIEKKTGESREEVQKYLDELTGQAKSMLGSAAAAARDYTQQAAKTITDTGRQTYEHLRSGYAQTEDLVQNQPMGSVAVSFGAGLALGIIVGLMLRSK